MIWHHWLHTDSPTWTPTICPISLSLLYTNPHHTLTLTLSDTHTLSHKHRVHSHGGYRVIEGDTDRGRSASLVSTYRTCSNWLLFSFHYFLLLSYHFLSWESLSSSSAIFLSIFSSIYSILRFFLFPTLSILHALFSHSFLSRSFPFLHSIF